MGRVSGSWGVVGWVRVNSYCEDPGTLTGSRIWRIGTRDAFVEYDVIEAKVHVAQIVARLAGIESREAALELKGREVMLRRADLPEPEEGSYYWSDLVGSAVVNLEGRLLGSVRRLFDNGAHDVMEISGERERLVPWTAVREVDIRMGRIAVDWGVDW